MYKQNKNINKEIETTKKNQREILQQKTHTHTHTHTHTIGVEYSPKSFNIKLTNQKKELVNLKKSH